MFHDLPVADGLHGRFIFREAVFKQFTRLVHQPAREHRIHTSVNPSA